MKQYTVFDTSIPADKSRIWNAEKEAASRSQGKSLADYFNTLVETEGLQGKAVCHGPYLGYAPPAIVALMDDDAAQKIETASKGRLKCYPVQYR